ncbi:uncharacterized protein K452DRAFT_318229 [Aplosporella prunicola CBS 121167]|uniref:Mediator of RNA polymerase II transcription subunit 5 n=1 Tax=Aplosporella prunicola CBS 121167 TaxID=1176127 RepID=A0A6A6BGT7_9PEZI|nr:uncharacterized protein K452DRAFT_318229 [Aplosporella prunicola CBS 121167]KAF2142643.1 hypothetical protein K452DRAFT_318229 [Aplosporella prunicola CBS 121167]
MAHPTPSLPRTRAREPSMALWTTFVDRCLDNRISPEKLEKFAIEMRKMMRSDGTVIAQALFRPRSRATSCLDPLVPVYLERLLALDLLGPPDILTALFHYSRDRPARAEETPKSPKKQISHGHITPEMEELVFTRLSKAYETGERPRSVKEVLSTLAVLSQWMSAIVTPHAADPVMHSMPDEAQATRTQSILVLGMLITYVMQNVKVAGVMEVALPKALRKSLAQSLALFNPQLSQAGGIALAERLAMFQKQYNLLENTGTGPNDTSVSLSNEVALLQLESVMDLPLINTRAGLYVFINSLLIARPLTDDNMVLSYLHTRYKGDIQSLAVDLVTASFDVLAAMNNATYGRTESNETIFNFRSFLVNKIPTLLTILAGSMFPPLTPELCITQALNHIDRNAFPSFSQAFDMTVGNSMLSDVRQDFLFACALHRLIPESSIERLLGETPMSSVPDSGKYIKENLVAQCSTNFERVEELLNEIEGMDGNAGAIVAAMTEIIRNLCATRETMSLKTICNALSRKPRSLDIMLQYTSPISILQPICQLLDTWKNEEDQGEYQPVYDEFGALLLLVLAFVHRHDLQTYELGLEEGSFVAQLLERGHVSLLPSEMTEEQNKHFSGWIHGLYDPEGISDELLSSCQPQDFYLLVPTLFHQTIYAISEDVLSLDTVKGGLEFLLETFLLPCLVGAVQWMTSYALEQPSDLDITMQVLTRLIRPASISGDAQAMHSTILAIVSRRLERCLKSIQHREPQRTDVGPLLDIVHSCHDWERTPYPSMAELEPWMATPGTSTRLSLRNTIQSLALWNSTADLNPTPPAYTHRQLFVALQLFSPRKVLHALLDELKAQTTSAGAGAGAVALDIATNMVCAPLLKNSCTPTQWLGSPVPAPPQPHPRLNLRDTLKAELHDDAAGLLQRCEPGVAEAAIRLLRRVEAQLAGPVAAAAAAVDHVALGGAEAGAMMQGIEMGGTGGMDLSGAGVGVGITGGGSGGGGGGSGDGAGAGGGGDAAGGQGAGAQDLGAGLQGHEGLDLGVGTGGADDGELDLGALGEGTGMEGVLDAGGSADDDVFSGLGMIDDEFNF